MFKLSPQAQVNGSHSGKDTAKRPGTAKRELHAQGVAEAQHMVDSNVLIKTQNVTDVTRRATDVTRRATDVTRRATSVLIVEPKT